jgi:sugar lactone lactonase YvrE
MDPSLRVAALLLGTIAVSFGASAGPEHLARGQTEIVLPLQPLVDVVEGIAVDHHGNVYVSDSRLENDHRVSEILKLAPGGTVSLLATLDPHNGGVAGLVVNPRGEVFATLISEDARTHGIWRVEPEGSSSRLPGSAQMTAPNALAFDAQGNLYATDSITGSVWRFPRGGRGALWLRDDLLAGFPEGPIGANGIAFVPPASLYVANTNFGWIVRIPIEPGGRAGRAKVIAMGSELLIVDGLAADAHGGLHAAIAGASITGSAPLVDVDPRTGAITPSTDNRSQFDFPTSLAFGAGPLDHKSVYVVNSGFFPEDRPEAAPGIVRVGIGVPGLPAH